jgi:vacuolar-type H+-ATPase subunit H
MVENIINSIIEAEEEAAREVKAAQIAAKEILLAATNECESISRDAVKDAKVKVKEINSSSEAAADQKSADIIEMGRKDAEALIAGAGKGKKIAVDKITRRIAGKYGNS